ncbi:STAS domain-containing protein [Nocardia sp. NPDC049190]|uniref:STAS domain-containing protein n=1 Tax=Nocardia sp. NPDC049190 TaxID=3155650 RepID=UPI0033F5A66A
MSRHTEQSDPLQFSVCRPRQDVTLLMVGGEIDLATAPRLRAELTRVGGGRTATLVLDLSPVTFLAAAGLTVLVEAQAEAVRSDCRVLVITKERNVDRVLRITGLSTGFHLVGSVDAALAESAAGYGETA